MQNLYDGRYAVYIPDYSIGPMVNECQMTRSNTRPSQAHVQVQWSPVQPRSSQDQVHPCPGPVSSSQAVRPRSSQAQVQPCPGPVSSSQAAKPRSSPAQANGLSCIVLICIMGLAGPGLGWTWSWLNLDLGWTWAGHGLGWTWAWMPGWNWLSPSLSAKKWGLVCFVLFYLAFNIWPPKLTFFSPEPPPPLPLRIPAPPLHGDINLM